LITFVSRHVLHRTAGGDANRLRHAERSDSLAPSLRRWTHTAGGGRVGSAFTLTCSIGRIILSLAMSNQQQCAVVPPLVHREEHVGEGGDQEQRSDGVVGHANEPFDANETFVILRDTGGSTTPMRAGRDTRPLQMPGFLSL
jgi:hypothetical protein